MATTSIVKLPPTGEPFIDALTNGTYWVLDGTRTVTWAVADAPGIDWKWNSQGASLMRDAMGSVLSKYAEVANIRFEYVGWFDDQRTAPADIVLAATQFPSNLFMPASVYAWAYFPNEPATDGWIAQLFGSSDAYPNASGDVVLNFSNREIAMSDFTPGSNGYFALLHEVGHAVGLKHPHDNGGTLGRPTFAQLGFSDADNQILTNMSYDPATTLAAWFQRFGLPTTSGYPESLMPLDVLALQSIYGPNLTTRAGPSVYELYNDDAIETFWDAGGQDVLTASGSYFGWNIISVSSVKDDNLVVAIPRDWGSNTGKFYFNVEHLEGSHFDDLIVGTVSPNILVGLGGDDNLMGNGGDDLIDGGAGLDAASYNDQRSNYSVRVELNAWTVASSNWIDGKDSVIGVERLHFTDRSVALDVYPGGSAHSAALIMRAVFGPSSFSELGFVGAGIALLDTGLTFNELVAAAISIPYFEELAGSRSNGAFLRLVYDNVVGVAPSPGDLRDFTSLLDTGAMTQTELGVFAALVGINSQSVELVGFQTSGIDYLPFPLE